MRHLLIKWGVVNVAKDTVNPNLELLEETLTQVRAEAKKRRGGWNQTAWRCESGMCFAGWAAHLAGARWTLEVTPETFEDNWMRGDFVNVTTPDGRDVPVWQYAEEALRLGEWDSHALFDAVNDLEDIELICDVIRDKAVTEKAKAGKA